MAKSISRRLADSASPTGAIDGTLSTAAQTNITSVGTLSALTVSGDLTVDTSTLKVDSTNNRVGIGTSSPRSILDLDGGSETQLRLQTTNSGSTTGDGLLISLDSSTNAKSYIWNYENAEMIFGTNNTERMHIAASGNVGIGTSSPNATLEVASGTGNTDAGTDSPTIRITNDTQSADWDPDDVIGTLEFQLDDASGNAPYDAAFIKTVNDVTNGTLASGALTFGTATYNTAGGAVERMRIDSSGLVGIGIDAPANPLSISFQAHGLYSQHRPSNGIGTGQEMYYKFNTANGTPEIFSSIYTEIESNTDGAESGKIALRAAAAGSLTTGLILVGSTSNVGIGTNSPAARLHVKTGASQLQRWERSGNIIAFEASSGASSGYGFYDTVASVYDIYLKNGNVSIGGVTSPSASLLVQGADQIDGTLRLNPHSNKGSRASHVHHGTNGDWYIRSADTDGKVIINDGGGNVGIGDTTATTTIDLTGAMLMRSNITNIGLGTYTVGNGMNTATGGELEFIHQWTGTMSTNDTIAFTYNALNWKSWWFEILISSTASNGEIFRAGGYNNNSSGHSVTQGSGASLVVSRSGQANTFTLTLSTTHIHPLMKIRYGCGGGEGPPQISRAALVITS